jgi:hypothetical protein
MRCDDLTRELACPTGAISPADLADHLATCPVCASWSHQAARLDRIWELTRPVPPSGDTLDALWAHASVELDGRRPSVRLKLVGADRRRRWLVAGFVLAQAAAVLVAGLVLLCGNTGQPMELANVPPVGAPTTQDPELFDFEAESDILPVVRIDEKNVATLEQVDLSYRLDSRSIPTGTQKDLMDEGETMASFGSVLASAK